MGYSKLQCGASSHLLFHSCVAEFRVLRSTRHHRHRTSSTAAAVSTDGTLQPMD
ncbi:Protein of unknown function [Pyronema omphalodes CBS 100304]|uniref:Uncharacterized protein n=1 Tax=Pyronema omphalodes (strain CBS 100304) TaxID=1076935 RepID=U4LEM2_PYROM|nr:Protein of unknown function [Pyronema omphalodes CBS 100304]